jgi:hypothetical protein
MITLSITQELSKDLPRSSSCTEVKQEAPCLPLEQLGCLQYCSALSSICKENGLKNIFCVYQDNCLCFLLILSHF